MLICFAATALYLFCYALETRKTAYYASSLLTAFCVPLIKSSGVFIVGVIVLCIAYKLTADRHSINLRSVGIGFGACVVAGLALTAFWFYPHRAELAEFHQIEIAAKQTPNLIETTRRTVML